MSAAGPSPFVPAAEAAAAKYGIPTQILLKQVSAESGWNPGARSPAGAMGLLQLMPGTARGLGVSNPFNPVENLDAGARYLREQYDRFGNWRDALAAYNAGPGRVADGSWRSIPETVHYVSEILGGAGNLPAGGRGSAAGSRDVLGAPVASQGASSALDSLLLQLATTGEVSPTSLLAALSSPGSSSTPVGPPGLPPSVAGGTVANPVPNSSFERVDQGVDFLSRSPVRALGPGEILSVTKGMAGGTGDIIKELLDHPVTVNGHSYREIYYSEQSPLVRAGQHVAAGDAVMAPGGNEIGFLMPDGSFPPLIGGLGAGTQPTQQGRDFLAYLRSLGTR